MAFLRQLARDVVQSARVLPGSSRANSPTNSVGFTLICPGGNYPAYWIRDFAMTLDSGFITPEEMRNHLLLTARAQNGPLARRLANGLIIPPFSIPDHINFDGGAVFYPGTMSATTNQGNGTFGILPPIDDHFEFVHIAYRLLQTTQSTNFLGENIKGLSILQRLVAAFEAPQIEPQTGLVETGMTNRAVGFGFCDTVVMTGKLLYPSLLRYRAAGELAEIHSALRLKEQAQRFHGIQTQIREHLSLAFARDAHLGGWLRASTGISGQADVWGTIYALYLGVLPPSVADQALHTVLDSIRSETITYQGAVRHVPTNMNHSAVSAWERTTDVPLGTYQNGAYWHTPTGWLLSVVAKADPELAKKLFHEYVQHLRDGDYRRGGKRQAPWETFAPNGYCQNGVYMTSVALPLPMLETLQKQ